MDYVQAGLSDGEDVLPPKKTRRRRPKKKKLGVPGHAVDPGLSSDGEHLSDGSMSDAFIARGRAITNGKAIGDASRGGNTVNGGQHRSPQRHIRDIAKDLASSSPSPLSSVVKLDTKVCARNDNKQSTKPTIRIPGVSRDDSTVRIPRWNLKLR